MCHYFCSFKMYCEERCYETESVVLWTEIDYISLLSN